MARETWDTDAPWSTPLVVDQSNLAQIQQLSAARQGRLGLYYQTGQFTQLGTIINYRTARLTSDGQLSEEPTQMASYWRWPLVPSTGYQWATESGTEWFILRPGGEFGLYVGQRTPSQATWTWLTNKLDMGLAGAPDAEHPASFRSAAGAYGDLLLMSAGSGVRGYGSQASYATTFRYYQGLAGIWSEPTLLNEDFGCLGSLPGIAVADSRFGVAVCVTDDPATSTNRTQQVRAMRFTR